MEFSNSLIRFHLHDTYCVGLLSGALTLLSPLPQGPGLAVLRLHSLTGTLSLLLSPGLKHAPSSAPRWKGAMLPFLQEFASVDLNPQGQWKAQPRKPLFSGTFCAWPCHSPYVRATTTSNKQGQPPSVSTCMPAPRSQTSLKGRDLLNKRWELQHFCLF